MNDILKDLAALQHEDKQALLEFLKLSTNDKRKVVAEFEKKLGSK